MSAQQCFVEIAAHPITQIVGNMVAVVRFMAVTAAGLKNLYPGRLKIAVDKYV
mgnify:CR=1 FL=1